MHNKRLKIHRVDDEDRAVIRKFILQNCEMNVLVADGERTLVRVSLTTQGLATNYHSVIGAAHRWHKDGKSITRGVDVAFKRARRKLLREIIETLEATPTHCEMLFFIGRMSLINEGKSHLLPMWDTLLEPTGPLPPPAEYDGYSKLPVKV